jgi:Bacterial protein of unknown function (DUF924)
MIDIAQANTAGVFEFARQLSTAKSSSDLFELWTHTPKGKRRCSTNRSRSLRRSERNSLAKAPRRSREASARLSRQPLDHSAGVVANRALARGFHQATDELMRPFFYLPFMHSEAQRATLGNAARQAPTCRRHTDGSVCRQTPDCRERAPAPVFGKAGRPGKVQVPVRSLKRRRASLQCSFGIKRPASLAGCTF